MPPSRDARESPVFVMEWVGGELARWESRRAEVLAGTGWGLEGLKLRH